MTSKRTGLIAGGILALLLGTAGLAAAQDPTPTGRPGMNGGGMMNGANGMMNGANGMMNGANGMMNGANGMMNGANGMMNGAGVGTMDADHLDVMTTMHGSMSAGGACDPALMQQMHRQVQPSR